MATVVSPKGVWSDPLSKPATMLSEGKRGEVLKEYPGTKAYRRVVGSGEDRTSNVEHPTFNIQ
jgi:hypothetical protein